MSNVTLRQLRYFDALARHGHFGRAAEVCAVSQPALSVQIKALEDTLGLTLVERGARSLRLTPFGHDCADRAAAILQSVDELSDLARAAQDGLTGRLRIGIIPTIAPYLLPALIGRVSRDHASLDVHVRETITPKLIHELHGGRLDAAILALPVSEPGLTEIPLFDEAFVLVRPLP
ncbi:MAG: LysR family transcriptional regulator, partial [Paracoccaceae bacterium]